MVTNNCLNLICRNSFHVFINPFKIYRTTNSAVFCLKTRRHSAPLKYYLCALKVLIIVINLGM